MCIVERLLCATALSLAVSTSPILAPLADAAGSAAPVFHGSGGFGGFHGGFAGGGHRVGGGAGFRASGFGDPDRRFHNDMVDRSVQFHGEHRDWHHYGHWENGAWVGIWPDYGSDPYDAYWSYYCDPASPYFNPDDCNGY